MIKPYNIKPTHLNDAFLVEPFISTDLRGAFVKDYSKEILTEHNINHDLQEVFYTVSKKGVIRAIHFQEVKEQAKLVRCLKGAIYDVIVDLRENSSTYLHWEGFYLNDENMNQIYVPKGFGHGYLVLEDAVVSYKCDEKFYGQYDAGIIWNDATLNINWPLHLIGGKNNLILSEKDCNLPTFKEWKSNYDRNR